MGSVDSRRRRVLDRGGEDAVTDLEWILAAIGLMVTALVVAGMILLTPRGEVELDRRESLNGQGAELSRAELSKRARSRR